MLIGEFQAQGSHYSFHTEAALNLCTWCPRAHGKFFTWSTVCFHCKPFNRKLLAAQKSNMKQLPCNNHYVKNSLQVRLLKIFIYLLRLTSIPPNPAQMLGEARVLHNMVFVALCKAYELNTVWCDLCTHRPNSTKSPYCCFVSEQEQFYNDRLTMSKLGSPVFARHERLDNEYSTPSI